MKKAHKQTHYRYAEHLRHSLRNGVTAYTRSPRCAGLVSHRRLARHHGAKLDTSVGVPGPRDFAVRAGIARPARPARPSHPAHNVRDDREAPLFGRRGMATDNHIFPKSGSKNFDGRYLDAAIGLNRQVK
jgi:hypothetical protein